LLFFLNKGSTVVVILSPLLNRLIDMDCHPFFVFGKRRVGPLEIAEFSRFVRRTRYVGEERRAVVRGPLAQCVSSDFPFLPRYRDYESCPDYESCFGRA
jgi:hypothetical protein